VVQCLYLGSCYLPGSRPRLSISAGALCFTHLARDKGWVGESVIWGAVREQLALFFHSLCRAPVGKVRVYYITSVTELSRNR